MAEPAAVFFVAVLLGLFSAAACQAQPQDSLAQTPDSLVLVQAQDSLLAAMRAAYENLDYEQARLRATEVLALYDQLTTEQRIEVHTTLAVVHYSTNEEEEARRHFEAALTLAPDLQLDPVAYSPKIVAFFDEVKASRPQPPAPEPEIIPPVIQYVTLPDPIPQAALRSVILPGWGQIYKGQRARGRVLLGAWALTAGGAAASHAIYRQRYADYEDAETTPEARERYDRYNSWYKARNNFALAAGAVWLYSYVDALLARSPAAQSNAPLVRAGLLPGPGRIAFSARLSF